MRIVKNFKSFINENQLNGIEKYLTDPKVIEMGKELAKDPESLQKIIDELEKNGVNIDLLKSTGQNIINEKPIDNQMKSEILKVDNVVKNESYIQESRIGEIIQNSTLGALLGAGITSFCTIGDSLGLNALSGPAIAIATAIGAAIVGSIGGLSTHSFHKKQDKLVSQITNELEKFINISLEKFNNDKEKTFDFVFSRLEDGLFKEWCEKNLPEDIQYAVHSFTNFDHGTLNHLSQKVKQILGINRDNYKRISASETFFKFFPEIR